jgi:hypothetical protein
MVAQYCAEHIHPLIITLGTSMIYRESWVYRRRWEKYQRVADSFGVWDKATLGRAGAIIIMAIV